MIINLSLWIYDPYLYIFGVMRVIKITPSVARTCLAYNFSQRRARKMSLVANARDIFSLLS